MHQGVCVLIWFPSLDDVCCLWEINYLNYSVNVRYLHLTAENLN